MKICFWGNISEALLGRTSGGGELQVAFLAKALALKGHEVVIVDPYSNKSFVTEEGVQLINVPNWNKGIVGLRLFWNRIPALWKIFLAQKADYYYVRMRSYLHLIPYLAAKKNKSKYIIGIASDIDVLSFQKKFKYSYRKNYNLFRLLSVNIPNDIVFRYLLKRSDHIILQHSGQHFGSADLQRRQTVFPNIIEPYYISASKNASKEYFLYVGSLTMLKGADNLFKLINIVDDSIAFKIVGSPGGRKPAKIYQKLQNKKNIQLEGWKDHQETLELISKSRALINTSFFEGFSNVFLEAWAAGIPVISLHVNPGKILEKYGLGICCDGDINRMKQIIETGDLAIFDKDKMSCYISKFHKFDTAADRFIKILNNAS